MPLLLWRRSSKAPQHGCAVCMMCVLCVCCVCSVCLCVCVCPVCVAPQTMCVSVLCVIMMHVLCVCVLQNAVLCHRDILKRPRRPKLCCVVMCCALKRPRQHCYSLLVVSSRHTQGAQHGSRNIKPQAFAFKRNCLKARNFSHLFVNGVRFSMKKQLSKENLKTGMLLRSSFFSKKKHA